MSKPQATKRERRRDMATLPRVLNMRDFPDGVPDGAIYCGRSMSRRRLKGSPFANPFKLGRKATDTERAECIAMYERWLMMQPALLAQLHTLAGHDLACWCAPLPCHCDVLVRLANEGAQE
jgi:hypothetical protein